MYRVTTTFLILTLVASAFSLDSVYNSVAAPGDLDITFSGDGKLTDTFPGSGYGIGNAVAIQQDNKIVVAGSRSIDSPSSRRDFAVIRYLVDGSPDASFGVAGKVATQLGTDPSQANAVAIQPDGRIVAAGESVAGFALVRYEQNGTLDPSFGSGGIVETPGGFGKSLALQPDGKILVAGYTRTEPDSDFMTARYNYDGSLDTSFENDGVVITSLSSGNDQCYSIAVQPDGKIVLAGTAFSSIALVRYRVDGLLDRSFDRDGKVFTNVITSVALSVAIQPDGRIVTAGTAQFGFGYRFALARFNPNGSLDLTFGPNGIFITTLGGEDVAYGIVLQADGKIVAAGSAGSGAVRRFGIVRYNQNGSRDLSFGNSGIKIVEFRDIILQSVFERATSVAIDSLGRIVVAGLADGEIGLARLLGDGTAPTSTGSVSGRIITANGNGITKVRVTLTSPSGQSRAAITGSFGYYRFDDVLANASYTISVSAKRYSFANPSRVINVQNDVTDVDFVSVE